MVNILEARDLKKYYGKGDTLVKALDGVNLTVADGEFVAIVGTSGSGKSTLLHMLGGLDRPTSGAVTVDGKDIFSLKDEALTIFRRRKIGFVFQNFCLISRVSALRNVEMPLMYAGMGRRQRRERAMELLDMVGMADRCSHKPAELSGGQKQRVAIARAMANDPEILLADEPTGALDSATGRLVMDIFHDLHRRQGKTILLITHSRELAEETQRMVTLSDGKILSDAMLGQEGGRAK